MAWASRFVVGKRINNNNRNVTRLTFRYWIDIAVNFLEGLEIIIKEELEVVTGLQSSRANLFDKWPRWGHHHIYFMLIIL